ncbi:hypothetical protein ACFOGI_07615 [Virgibacillus xinjiangensis]|uniref:Type II secretory pathway, pseudopilin PulG n=1 Tax=Virgibacillus xinjiangensis TaxID=393090 RepID=A0ABV7CUM1_9BACI
MKWLRNDRGAALVMVMLIITLFLVFIMTMLTQVTNTARQVATTEEQADARLVAEMGVDYVEFILAQGRMDAETLEELLNEIDMELDKDREFRIEVTRSQSGSLDYKSVGRSGNQDVEIENTITIRTESGKKDVET